jgi:hypothetical protein
MWLPVLSLCSSFWLGRNQFTMRCSARHSRFRRPSSAWLSCWSYPTNVRTDDAWEEWLLFMLHGVEQTSWQTIWIIKGMRELMLDYKQRIRGTFKFYS